MKGYLSEKNAADFGKLIVGDSILGVIVGQQGNDSKSKKLQISQNINIFNCFLGTKSLVPGELIQGTVDSIEAKGYMINLHTHDKSHAFLKFGSQQFSLDQRLYVTIIENKNPKSGIVVAKIASNEDKIVSQQISFEQVKPGFRVECRVKKVVDNGIHVSFCNGIEGVIFEDSLEKNL